MSTTPISDTSAAPVSPAIAETTPPGDYFDSLPVPVIECNVLGIITRANHTARGLVHAYGINFLGKAIWALVAPDEQQTSHDAFFVTMADTEHEPEPIRRSLYTQNGGYRVYQIGRCFLFDPDGKPSGLRMVLMDVTDHALAYERDKMSRLWLESISDSLAEAVIVTDTLGFIRFANQAATQLTGWESHELLRMTVSRAIPILSYSKTDAVPFNYRLVLERRSSGLITFLDKNHQQTTVAFYTAPVLDRIQGSTIGVSYVLHKPCGSMAGMCSTSPKIDPVP